VFGAGAFAKHFWQFFCCNNDVMPCDQTARDNGIDDVNVTRVPVTLMAAKYCLFSFPVDALIILTSGQARVMMT